MRLTNLILLVVPFVSGQAFCQQPAQGGPKPACSFAQVYRKDGWIVPGLEGAKVKQQRSKVGGLENVFVTLLQPAKVETDFLNVWCSAEQPGRLVVENQPIKILSLWSFDFDGRLFAYGVAYAREAAQDGVRSELGAASAVYFYDVDGDGRFSVIKGGSFAEGLFRPPFIPDWAKNNTRIQGAGPGAGVAK